MNHTEIFRLIGQLTLEEKAGLCSGKDNWFTKAVERLDIPSVRTSDGPHGLRTQDGSVNSMAESDAIPAVCYPAACATAASFDEKLLEKMGRQLGKECQALGVHVLLGPGVNIKRSPLGGRNFEYFSEDPLLAGRMGTALVKGIQSEGVGGCVKHFFGNSQEHRRMDSSSEMDERTMREIYLPAFEQVVKEAKPWMMMAAYNKLDGTYATESHKYLTEVLREEWDFEGVVTSDWGATHNRVAAVTAGCDLTMPAEDTDELLVQAVKDGSLKEEVLDSCCARIIALALKASENQKENQTFDYAAGNELSKEIATESMVLLKNEKHLLPLSKNAKVAFIGAFAEQPRYQGGGSSHIKSYQIISALEAAKEYDVIYAPGYSVNMMESEEALVAQAVEVAREAEAAVVFVGLTEQMESEGVDRRHLRLSEAHNTLIHQVCMANPNTVVVLHNGAPVEMPWVNEPKAILEAYLGGEAIGAAVVDVLFGNVNPSGHLPETFPKKLSDNPSYLFYFGEGDRVQYSERFFVGYRYYITKEMEPLFHFGHGLSYTEFSYHDLTLDKNDMDDTDTVRVSVTVTNTGARAGKALVQLYVVPPRAEIIRPIRELKEFQKVSLQPGESKKVDFILDMRAFAHWSENYHDWRVEDGNYHIQICENASKVFLEETIRIHATKPLRPVVYNMDMNLGEFVKTSVGYQLIDDMIGFFMQGMAASGVLPAQAVEAMKAMGGGTITLKTVDMMAEKMNLSATGSSGIEVLFSQPVSIMTHFLSQEQVQKIRFAMEELNHKIQ